MIKASSISCECLSITCSGRIAELRQSRLMFVAHLVESIDGYESQDQLVSSLITCLINNATIWLYRYFLLLVGNCIQSD